MSPQLSAIVTVREQVARDGAPDNFSRSLATRMGLAAFSKAIQDGKRRHNRTRRRRIHS